MRRSKFPGGVSVEFNDVLKTTAVIYDKDPYVTIEASGQKMVIDVNLMSKIVAETKRA